MITTSPATVVQAQLDAYNAKDIEALLRTYAQTATHFEVHGPQLAHGHGQLRVRFEARLAEPDLHARLISRNVVGNIVVDVEVITRNFPEGLGTIEMLCIYEVVDGCIRQALFAVGKKTLHGVANGFSPT